MTTINRRDLLKLSGASLAAAAIGGPLRAQEAAKASDVLTIAYNVVLPTWDPTLGPFSVNPSTQSLYKTVFDQYVDLKSDLSFKPGLLTKWGWNEDKTKVLMEVREGAFWHDGSPVTPEDIVWSLERAADPKTGVITQPVWKKVGNYQIDGNKITGDVLDYEPVFLKYLAFLTAYVLPKKAYEAMGTKAFGEKPIGSGPYMVEEFQRNSFVRLRAFPQYWGPKPAFDTVVFKFVTDGTSRVAEIERGSSDLTFDIPFEEYDRLRKKPGLTGVTTPISNVGMIFITNVDPMLDKNVRLALNYAIDKKALVDRLLRGYGVPLDTLETPDYINFDPTIKTGYRPDEAKRLMAASGYSPEKPVKFTIQTTHGYKPKDYEVIEAIVGMWRKIGAEATIEVYEIAKHFELRSQHKLAPAAFGDWGNSIGDPRSSTGGTMYGAFPNSGWKTEDLDAMIRPLLNEKDEEKRLAGYKAVSRYIAEQGYVIPLFQYVQPIIYKSDLTVTPHKANFILPQLIGRK
jgi:peptide/nickel transport system substrate-binding protein